VAATWLANSARAEDGGNYEDIDSGRVAHAQCTAFTTESSLDNATRALLDSTGIFYVSTKSYMFYEYSVSGDDSSYSTSMMVDLDVWIESMAAVKGSTAPNCTQIEDGKDIFSDNHKVQSLFGSQYSEDSSYTPALYEGPICGMGSDKNKIERGVFLDSECTVLAPKLMYNYRNKIANSQVAYNVTDTIDVVAAASKKTLSCKKYAICGQLLGSSVSTQFCDQSGGRRRVEDVNGDAPEGEQHGQEEDAGQQDEQDQGDQYNDATNNQSWYSNIWSKASSSKQADHSFGASQLSQNDLDDMGSTCYAAVTSMNKGVTLESYLLYHGQLNTEDSRSMTQLVKLITLVAMGILGVIILCTSVKIRRVKKKKFDEKELEDSDSDASQASGTFASMEDGETLESGTLATMTTMETATVETLGTCTTMASTMHGQLWQDLKAAKREFWPNENQGQEVQRVTTPMTSNVASRKKQWSYSLKHSRTPDDHKMPLVTAADEGMVTFNPPFFTPGEDDLPLNKEKSKKSSWRPSLRTGNHRGFLPKVVEESV
jgi:hypothetical protein